MPTPTAAQLAATKALEKVGRPRVFWPVSGRISQRPAPGHEALDIAAKWGTPVYLPVGGRVTAINRMTTGYGLNVRVRTMTGLEEVFGHLSEEDVTLGDILQPGALIGRVGSSGYSSGPHLHYEVRRPGSDVFLGQRSTTSAIDPYSILGGASPRVVSSFGTPPTRTTTTARQSTTPGSQAAQTVSRAIAQTPPKIASSGKTAEKTVSKSGKPLAESFTLAATPLGDISVPKPVVERLGLSLAGYVLIIVGIIGLIISYRAEISNAANSAVTVAKVAAVA